MSNIPPSILDTIYPLGSLRRTRPPSKPMSVLALGLSRSGTDSLRAALVHLGYTDTYHGMSTVESATWADCRTWYELLMRKFHHRIVPHDRQRPITTADFDRILGECMAITDIPAVMLGPELLTAYPGAKVVLNRRTDTQVWKDSFRATTLAAEKSWIMYILSFFNAELFWMERVFILCIGALFDGHFEKSAEKVYEEHYGELERILKENQRQYLKWEVSEGWQPLCEYLGKEVPDIDFPRRNIREDHDARIGRLVKQRVDRAMRTMILLVAGCGVVVLAVFWTGRRQL